MPKHYTRLTMFAFAALIVQSILLYDLDDWLSSSEASPSYTARLIGFWTMSPCVADQAETVSIKDLKADPENYFGQCIRVSGLMNVSSLFADIDDMYRSTTRARPTYNHLKWPSGEVYIGNPRLSIHKKLPSPHRTQVNIVGVVRWCEGDEGCAYNRGYWIDPEVIELDNEPAPRLIGPEHRASFGNLLWAEPDWPALPDVTQIANEWLKTVQVRDLNTYVAKYIVQSANESFEKLALAIESGNPRNLDEHDLKLFSILGDRTSPYEDLRKSDHHPQQAFFRVKEREDGDFLQHNTKLPVYTVDVCYCLTADCSGLWPISSLETYASPELPYVCTSFSTVEFDNNLWQAYGNYMQAWMAIEFPSINDPLGDNMPAPATEPIESEQPNL